MNLDKKLAKYTRQIKNPKYYGKILDIFDEAEEKNYQFKDFTLYDLEYLTGEIEAYYSVIETDEEDKRMVEYFNDIWIIVSDKHYILAETPYLWIALSVYIRCYMFLFWSKLTRLINPIHCFECNNIDSELYLFRGALKAAEYLECEVFDLEEYRLG